MSPRRLTPRGRTGRDVRGRAPAPEGAAAARRAREQRRLESSAIAAADEVFARDGFERASLAEIARVARTTVKRLYDLFTSKERLFAAVLVDHVEALEDQIRRAVLRVEGARERLEAIVWTRASMAAERRTLSRLLLEESTAVGPDVRRAFGRIAARTRAAFMEGVRSHELRSELGPELMASMFDAAARAYLVERVLAREDDPTEQETQALVGVLLDGMAAEVAPRRPARARR